MWKLVLLILPLTSAYYSTTFFKKGCIKDFQYNNVFALREVLFCPDVHFTAKDRNEILEEHFVLSDEDIIYFVDSDLGEVNHNFFTKFPDTGKMVFYNVTMHLKSSTKIGTDEDDFIPLETLIILNSKILHNKNSNSFHSLSRLHNLEISQSFFEEPIIDAQLFRNVRNLSLSYLQLSGIESEAFSELSDLSSLELIGLNLTYLNPKLLQNNSKLKNLNLKYNLFTEIPTSLPGSLEVLALMNNKLERTSKEDWKDLKNLKELYLNNNLLSNIESDAFDNLVNLEILNLRSNKLTKIDNRIVKYLKNLRGLYLKGNMIEEQGVSEMFLYAGYEP